MSTIAHVPCQISWYICTIIPCFFLFLRLFSRWQKFGRLALDDYFLILAALCLIGDLAIQQHMWNLGLGNMAEASQEDFIGIMKVCQLHAIHSDPCSHPIADDRTWFRSLCLFSLVYQVRSCSLLQETCRSGIKDADCLQLCTRWFGCHLYDHLL